MINKAIQQIYSRDESRYSAQAALVNPADEKREGARLVGKPESALPATYERPEKVLQYQGLRFVVSEGPLQGRKGARTSIEGDPGQTRS